MSSTTKATRTTHLCDHLSSQTTMSSINYSSRFLQSALSIGLKASTPNTVKSPTSTAHFLRLARWSARPSASAVWTTANCHYSAARCSKTDRDRVTPSSRRSTICWNSSTHMTSPARVLRKWRNRPKHSSTPQCWASSSRKSTATATVPYLPPAPSRCI